MLKIWVPLAARSLVRSDSDQVGVKSAFRFIPNVFCGVKGQSSGQARHNTGMEEFHVTTKRQADVHGSSAVKPNPDRRRYFLSS